MENILAIDTASAYLSLALQVDGKVHKYRELVANKQTENIIPQIKCLLADAGITANELNYIAYNQGPGSFTGLRIGLAVALGMAYGIHAKLIPIPAFAIHTLQAYGLTACKYVIVGLDARLKQLYVAGINAQTLEYFIPPLITNPSELSTMGDSQSPLSCHGHTPNVFIGDGFAVYKDLLPTTSDLEIINPEYPDATYLLKLANSGKFAPVTALLADLFYLRNKVALSIDEREQKL